MTIETHPIAPVGSVRDFWITAGLKPTEEMSAELLGYIHVLMGRVDPPIENGVMTLMEVANAYYSRAKEIEFRIHEGERLGEIQKGGDLYRFRTGELRDFIDLAKSAQELGSRRLTDAMREYQGRLGG